MEFFLSKIGLNMKHISKSYENAHKTVYKAYQCLQQEN